MTMTSVQQASNENKTDNKPRRLGLAALAILVGCAVVIGMSVYYGNLLMNIGSNVERLTSVLRAPSTTPPAATVRDHTETGSPVAQPSDTPHLSPAAAAVIADMRRFGLSGDLSAEALEALNAIDADLPPDELLIIESGVPSTYYDTSPAELSIQQRRVQAARSGSELAMLEIIDDLDSPDPAASGDAWAALRQMAHTDNAARLDALLVQADTDSAIRKRARELLRSLPYD